MYEKNTRYKRLKLPRIVYLRCSSQKPCKFSEKGCKPAISAELFNKNLFFNN